MAAEPEVRLPYRAGSRDLLVRLGGLGVLGFGYMREAKVLQIFEGTNQIQHPVIGRHLRPVS